MLRELNNNKKLNWGITIVLIIITGLWVLMTRAEACEPMTEMEIYEQCCKRSNWGGRPNTAYNRNQKQKWQEAYDDHHFHAVRTYRNAYNSVWYLPDISMRQLARDAWVAACSTVGGSTVGLKLVCAFSSMLSNYGLHCLDEWDYIEEQLEWSKFHFEKCQYYASMIQNN